MLLKKKEKKNKNEMFATSVIITKSLIQKSAAEYRTGNNTVLQVSKDEKVITFQ